jgi:hypothetical protein
MQIEFINDCGEKRIRLLLALILPNRLFEPIRLILKVYSEE